MKKDRWVVVCYVLIGLGAALVTFHENFLVEFFGVVFLVGGSILFGKLDEFLKKGVM